MDSQRISNFQLSLLKYFIDANFVSVSSDLRRLIDDFFASAAESSPLTGRAFQPF
jgi:hypothetical protein